MRGIFGRAFNVASISTSDESVVISSSRHPTGDTTKPRSWHSRLFSCSFFDEVGDDSVVVLVEFLVLLVVVVLPAAEDVIDDFCR